MKTQFFFKPTLLLLFSIAFLNLTNAQEQSCLRFDGQSSAAIPASVNQFLGTGDFTFEAWINGFEDDVLHSTILSNRTSTDTGFHFAIHNYWGGSQHKMLMFRYNGVNWMYINNGEFDAKILDGNCHHVAVSRAGENFTFFIDGKQIGTRVITATPDISTNAPILIGNDVPSASGFNGNISDVRMWNIGLTAEDIQDGMKEDVDPNSPGLIGQWEMHEGIGQTLNDATSKNDAVLGYINDDEFVDPEWGNACCSVVEKGECLTFDGNDQARIPVEVSQSLGTGDFTFEAQINGLEDDVSHSTILSNRTSINSGFHFAIHNYWGGSQHKMLMFRYNGVNWMYIDNGDFDAKVLDGSCHHVAVSRAGENFTFFIDGKQIGTRVITATPDISTDAPILIGNDEPSGSGFNGNISDVRIWNVGLSGADIQDGLENGVDPSDPDLIGSWEMKEGEGQVISDLTDQHHAFLGSDSANESIDPAWETECCSVPEKGECLTFNGQDQVNIPNAVSQNLGTKDFTFEAWISGLEDNVTHSTILSNRTSTNAGFHFAIHNYWGDSQHKMLMFRYKGVNWMFINNGDFDGKILDGDCHHVAITKSTSTLSFYIDGELIGARTIDPNVDLSTDAPILIGNDVPSGSGFNGKISDVRIWHESRTNEEIEQAYNNNVDIDSPNLVGFWEMREGAGQVIFDKTEQNHAALGSQLGMDSSDPTWQNNCCQLAPVSTTEIEDAFNNGIISVFPNPSTGQFNIKLNGKIADKNIQYAVYDVLGIVVANGELSNSMIDLQDMDSGQYWLRLNDGKEAIGTVKIVVIK